MKILILIAPEIILSFIAPEKCKVSFIAQEISYKNNINNYFFYLL
jgi:hypothetical protein